ncbi:MAG TPA: signal peptidase II [Tepidisphaeraceae bacterium]|nr:signal peptidase II [Tepidisphaeraceae bacterium]
MPSIWNHPSSLLRFTGTAAIGLTADLALKAWAQQRLASPDPDLRGPIMPIIPGWLELQYTDNHGAALGFLQGYRWMFLSVSVVAVAFLAYLFSASRKDQPGLQIILGMLLAGVLGNLYDRVYLGYVRDMIHIFPGHRWPDAIAQHLPAFWTTPEWFPWIFNIADSLLCVGVALMLIHGMIHAPKPAPEAPAQQPS